MAERLEAAGDVPIVFDPVMVATSGSALADDATIAAFGRLMDIATIVTPNLPELERADGGGRPGSRLRCSWLGAWLRGAAKGGHGEGDALADALIADRRI